MELELIESQAGSRLLRWWGIASHYGVARCVSEEARLVRGAGSVGRVARVPSSRREVLGVRCKQINRMESGGK